VTADGSSTFGGQLDPTTVLASAVVSNAIDSYVNAPVSSWGRVATIAAPMKAGASTVSDIDRDADVGTRVGEPTR
jgi:hypothetical protein